MPEAKDETPKPIKPRKQKGEERFEIKGKCFIALKKIPGKDGQISCYPDEWIVRMEVDRPNGGSTSGFEKSFGDDAKTALDYYNRLEEHLG